MHDRGIDVLAAAAFLIAAVASFVVAFVATDMDQAVAVVGAVLGCFYLAVAAIIIRR